MIEKQLIYTFAMFISGLIIMGAFDIYRLIFIWARRSVLPRMILDVLFSAVAGIFAFIIIYRYNDGIIRIYAIIAMLLGIFFVKYIVNDIICKKIRKHLKKLVSRCRMGLLKGRKDL
ncbi:MAG: hypothetical protein E7267_03305 [Lachnospiraceae bacterium]|nr:hypothetical protein [Lachnospiraceae bacterium]